MWRCPGLHSHTLSFPNDHLVAMWCCCAQAVSTVESDRSNAALVSEVGSNA